MTTIQFHNVGRSKACWSESFNQMLTDAMIVRSVKRKGALMSNDIEVTVSDDGTAGKIYAGIRPVGEFSIVSNP